MAGQRVELINHQHVVAQTPRGIAFGGTKISDRFVQVRAGGDQALFQAIGKHLLEVEQDVGGVLDHGFIAEHTSGFDHYRSAMADSAWSEFVEATGLPQKTLRSIGEQVRGSKATIVCWAWD